MKKLASKSIEVQANQVVDHTNARVGASRPASRKPDYASMQAAVRRISNPCGFDFLKEFYGI